MTILEKSLASWNTNQFKNIFIDEVTQLSIDELLLQKALEFGSMAIKDNLSIMVNRIKEQDKQIIIHSSILFSSTIAGCNCADDPTPVDTLTEYCELEFHIDKKTAQTEILLAG